jgi:hypothetical protein
MKYVCTLIVLLIFFSPVYLFSQDNKDSTSAIKFNDRIPADLEIDVKVKQTGAIDFAYCFKGQVINVVRGILPDTSILITIMAGDKGYYDILSGADEESIFKIFLMHNKSNEEYSTAYVTGFVDSDKNSWKIISIRMP